MDENERKISELILNPDTGKLFRAVSETTTRQYDVECDVISFGADKAFIKVSTQTMKLLMLTPSEELLAYHLLDYISYKDNILKHDNQLLDIKTIATLLEQEYETTRQIMKRIIQKGVIAVVKIGCSAKTNTADNRYRKAYVFNPYIATGERQVPGYVYSIFQKFGWGIRKCAMNFDDPVDISDVKDKFYSDSAKSYLYIIHDDSNNNIKIGVTNNIDRRLSELQTASAGALNMMYISPKCDNAYEIERKVHDHFSAYRKNGEWFTITPYWGIAYIETLFDTAGVGINNL